MRRRQRHRQNRGPRVFGRLNQCAPARNLRWPRAAMICCRWQAKSSCHRAGIRRPPMATPGRSNPRLFPRNCLPKVYCRRYPYPGRFDTFAYSMVASCMAGRRKAFYRADYFCNSIVNCGYSRMGSKKSHADSLRGSLNYIIKITFINEFTKPN